MLIGNADPTVGLLYPDDKRCLAGMFSDTGTERDLGPSGVGEFRSPWWPRTGLYGDAANDVAILDPDLYVWELPEVTKGCDSRYGISGTTRDQYGSPLGGVLVKLFRTSDDSLQSQIVSDVNNGTFLLTTPYYSDAHYIMAYKAGSPDVAGASVNTLVGS